MAAKINKTVKISLKDGAQGMSSQRKTVPGPGNVMGGGTGAGKSGAGFKTKNDAGAKGGVSTGVKAPDFGAARGTQKNSGNTGGNQY